MNAKSIIKLSVGVLGVTAAIMISHGKAWSDADQTNTPTRYQAVQKFMQDLAAQHPNTTTLIDITDSDSGEKVQGLKIGSGPVKTLLVATHHGNEYGSTELAKAFATSIAANPIANQTTFVIPVLNIWGYNRLSRFEWAKNRSNDPNRDYPGPCGGDGPYNLKSTKGLSDFLEREGIVSAITLHTFSPAVAYPWGFSTNDRQTAYEELFIRVANAAAAESHYTAGNSADVIYPADGTFEDYVFWKSGIWSLLFEVGDTHSPNQAQVQEIIRGNVPGIRAALEQFPTTRAPDHDFKGHCDGRALYMDLRNE